MSATDPTTTATPPAIPSDQFPGRDLNDDAFRHFRAIREELDKATRTLSADAFNALAHALEDVSWDLAYCSDKGTPADALRAAWAVDTQPA